MKLYENYDLQVRQIADCKNKRKVHKDLRCKDRPSINTNGHDNLFEMLELVLPAQLKIRP